MKVTNDFYVIQITNGDTTQWLDKSDRCHFTESLDGAELYSMAESARSDADLVILTMPKWKVTIEKVRVTIEKVSN